MRSKWVGVLAGAVAVVVLLSVVIGLASPDGSVGDDPVARPTTSAPTTSSATPTPAPATPDGTDPDRAPRSVRGTWPGAEAAGARVRRGDVDWCRGVRTTGSGEARRVFGDAAVERAACAAVTFVLEQRYSRLALPRRSYAAGDFDRVVRRLSPVTRAAYRARVARFVADPDDPAARTDLGLVLLRGAGTPRGAAHASAGGGRVFFGPAFSTRGYRGRAVWVNPRWSAVRVTVDRSTPVPRLVARVGAKADLPVRDPGTGRAEQMTVPTTARLFLRPQGGRAWLVSGWSSIRTGRPTFAPLRVERR